MFSRKLSRSFYDKINQTLRVATVTSTPQYPSVISITPTASTDKLSHSVAMPATVTANDLLLVFAASDNAANAIPNTAQSGWTRVANWNSTDAGSSIFVRKADGTEGGGTLTVSTALSEYLAAQVYRIQTWSGNLVDVVIGTLSSGGGNTATCPSLTSGFGSFVTLWIAFCGTSTLQSVTSSPSGYSAVQQAGAGGTNNAQVKTVYLQKTAASESPGTFVHGGTAPWTATTVAIKGSS